MKKRIKGCIAFVLALMIVITGMPAMTAKAADDFDAGKTVARGISLNTQYTTNRTNGTAQEWYKFTTVSYNAFYKVTYKNINVSYCNYNYFELVDSDGATMYKWGCLYAGEEESYYFKLQPNSTYYLKGYGTYEEAVGSYKFAVSPFQDVTDSMKSAGSVKTGQWYTSHLIYDNAETAQNQHDIDWYKIKNTTSADYLNFTFKNINGNSGTYFKVYDKDGAEIYRVYTDRGQQESADVPCKSNGTYYVSVELPNSNEWTDYKFKVNKVNDASRVKSKAQTIKLKKNYKYKINGIGDVDYYKIKLSKTGKYAFALKDICEKGWSTGLTMKVYNSKGKKVATVNGYNKKTVTKTVKNLKKGTYYIRISGDSSKMGNYTFNVKKK